MRSTAAASEEPPPSPAVTGVRLSISMDTPFGIPKRARNPAAARAARFPGPSSSGRPGTRQVIGPARGETATLTRSPRSSGTMSESRSW